MNNAEDPAAEPKVKEEFARTRMSLIERLANWEDQRTWDEFYQTYWRLIYSVSTNCLLYTSPSPRDAS